MKNLVLLSLIILLGYSGLFCSCNSNDTILEEQNNALCEEHKEYGNGFFKEEDVKLLFSEINRSISINGIDRTDIAVIYRSIFPFSSTRNAVVESDPLLFADKVVEEHSVFLEKIEIAFSMKKDNQDMQEILSVFNNEAEKDAVALIFNVIEQNSSLLESIAEEATGGTTQAGSNVGTLSCAIASGIAGALFSDMATMSGVAAAFGGFIGVSAVWGAAIIGIAVGAAYTMAFCR
ncbi:MAG: hypothetical protein LBU44_07605 [Mediterranea sp.]|jgi:hypothetical protein|nr:hypothetical protein [Mediterranea sp.]